MGLSDKQFTQSNNSLSIIGGKFTKRVQEGTIGAISRKITKGKHEGETIYEVGYPTLSGFLASGNLVDNEQIGMQAVIILKDADGEYELSFSAGVKEMSQHLKAIIRSLPNIDPSKETFFSIKENPKKKTRTGNPVFNLGVYQDGHRVKDFYTEWHKNEKGENVCTNLNGLPDAEKLRDGTYDYRDQNEFLLMRFEEYFSDFSPVEVKQQAAHQEADVPADEEDDAPF